MISRRMFILGWCGNTELCCTSACLCIQVDRGATVLCYIFVICLQVADLSVFVSKIFLTISVTPFSEGIKC